MTSYVGVGEWTSVLVCWLWLLWNRKRPWLLWKTKGTMVARVEKGGHGCWGKRKKAMFVGLRGRMFARVEEGGHSCWGKRKKAMVRSHSW